MAIARFGKSLAAKLKPFLEEKKPDITTQRCCVYITSSSIELIHVDKKEDRVEILLTQDFQFTDIESITLVLSSFVIKNNLTEVPTYWLLAPEDYQLFLIDSLPVPEEEIRDALTWRIRSMLSYPVDEAAIDYFLVPAKISFPEHPLIGTVSARKKDLMKTMKLIEKAGLPLMVIDVPELALKNLSSLYEDDEKCTAFIYFMANKIILNITLGKMLYFTRQISSKTTTSKKEEYENIGLEIMRYFDYFQSQWRHPSPSRIFVAADKNNDNAEIAKSLSENLLAKVDIYTIPNLIQDEEMKFKIESNLLLAFGCSLREGYQHVPTKN